MFQLLFLFFTANAEWTFTPQLYMRGGVTTDFSFDKATSKDPFNLGGYGDESNLVNNNLTELTLRVTNGKFTYVYGLDTDVDGQPDSAEIRFFDKTSQFLRKRLSYAMWTDTNFSAWVGRRRDYRGTGRYLTVDFPFDERNMLLGSGVEFSLGQGFKTEFAFGEGDGFDLVAVNKFEKALAKGKVKTNLEWLKVNGQDSGMIFGVSLEDWDRTVLGGNMYNNMFVEYGFGITDGGKMGNAFNGGKDPYKFVTNLNGDWKWSRAVVYYSLMFQGHFADDSSWSFADLLVRPLFKVTDKIAVGPDLAYRKRFTDKNLPNWGGDSYKLGDNVFTYAAMVRFAPTNNTFGTPVVAVSAGGVTADDARNYFGKGAKKSDYFLRFSYELSYN